MIHDSCVMAFDTLVLDDLIGGLGDTAVKRVQRNLIYNISVVCRTTRTTPRAVSSVRLFPWKRCITNGNASRTNAYVDQEFVLGRRHLFMLMPMQCSRSRVRLSSIKLICVFTTVPKPHTKAFHHCPCNENRQPARPILLHVTRNTTTYDWLACRYSKLVLRYETIGRNTPCCFDTEN